MKCAWTEFLSILPPGIRREVDRQGEHDLLELRLRLNEPPQLVKLSGSRFSEHPVTEDDLNFLVNAASRYSPWNAATAAQGYLTAPGGHRIGLCGEAVLKEGVVTGFRRLTSLCIRVARDVPGIGADLADIPGSIVILGAPGWGKTTLLRDLIRQKSDRGHAVGVVDERCELFPEGTGFPRGKCTDVLTGCTKEQGIEMLLRTMGTEYIAVDEITARRDGQALCQAAGCGVELLATAHAGSFADFLHRSAYRHLVESEIFATAVVLRPDKTYTLERMEL